MTKQKLRKQTKRFLTEMQVKSRRLRARKNLEETLVEWRRVERKRETQSFFLLRLLRFAKKPGPLKSARIEWIKILRGGYMI